MMFLDYLIHHNNNCNNSHHQLLLRQTSFQYDKASGCLLAALQTPPSTATPSVKSSFDVLLSKPVGWMNTSGVPVAKLMRNYHDCRLIIVHDELERPLGKWSWKLQGSASGHNGIKSIISSLGTDVRSKLPWPSYTIMYIYRNLHEFALESEGQPHAHRSLITC
jgi:peptidyl-tRNA hydrolase